MRTVPNMTVGAARLIAMSLAAYSAIRREYWTEVFDAVTQFIDGDMNMRQFKSAMRQAIVSAYSDTAEQAWVDGLGDGAMSRQAKDWLNARTEEEIGHAAELAVRLRAANDELQVVGAEFAAQARADGYAGSLDAVYANVKLLAAGRTMLTFGGSDGLESCRDCQRYKGQRHRASWWFAHGAVPPSRDFECKGYQCQHVLLDDDGGLFTI